MKGRLADKRRILLCNGKELLDKKATKRSQSAFKTLAVVKREFELYPSMTHAEVRDLRGNIWYLYRHDSFWKRMKFGFFAA